MKATVSNNSKINDFGAKIGGARKDKYARLAEMVEQLTADALRDSPLSKLFKLPDLRKMFLDGDITAEQARKAWFVYTLIEKKPARYYSVKSWADETINKVKLISAILSDENKEIPSFYKEFKHLYFMEEMTAANWPADEYKRGSLSLSAAYYGTGYIVLSGRTIKKRAQTVAECIDFIRAANGAEKRAQFEIRKRCSTGEYFINLKGKPRFIIRRNIQSGEEARRMIREENDALQAELKALRTAPNERRDENRARLGMEHRGGLDITPDQFSEKIAFRGVEFGNWVNQKERAACLNECFDALCDLSKITGISLTGCSLNGSLAMAFGARGVTKAMAHYEPTLHVINLTKRAGAGCLAHEWFHALDNYIITKGLGGGSFATNAPHMIDNTEMQNAAKALKIALNAAPFCKRSAILDAPKEKPYWSTTIELAARAFEAYIYFKLEASGQINDYLVNFKSLYEYEAAEMYPYPTREEIADLNPLFDAFLSAAFAIQITTAATDTTAEQPAAVVAAPEPAETPAPAVADTTTQQPAAAAYEDCQKSQIFNAIGVTVEQYSAKAVALFGETKAIKEHLKTIGARFNPSLTRNGSKVAGWIFSAARLPELLTMLTELATPPQAAAIDTSAATPMAASYGVSQKSLDTGSAADSEEVPQEESPAYEIDSKPIALEIIRQLGGNRFTVMTGCKPMVRGVDSAGHAYLEIKLTANKIRAQWLSITLNGLDLYDMVFFKKNQDLEITIVKEYKNVYNDMLQDLFTEATGLYTHF